MPAPRWQDIGTLTLRLSCAAYAAVVAADGSVVLVAHCQCGQLTFRRSPDAQSQTRTQRSEKLLPCPPCTCSARRDGIVFSYCSCHCGCVGSGTAPRRSGDLPHSVQVKKVQSHSALRLRDYYAVLSRWPIHLNSLGRAPKSRWTHTHPLHKACIVSLPGLHTVLKACSTLSCYGATKPTGPHTGGLGTLGSPCFALPASCPGRTGCWPRASDKAGEAYRR